MFLLHESQVTIHVTYVFVVARTGVNALLGGGLLFLLFGYTNDVCSELELFVLIFCVNMISILIVFLTRLNFCVCESI